LKKEGVGKATEHLLSSHPGSNKDQKKNTGKGKKHKAKKSQISSNKKGEGGEGGERWGERLKKKKGGFGMSSVIIMKEANGRVIWKGGGHRMGN